MGNQNKKIHFVKKFIFNDLGQIKIKKVFLFRDVTKFFRFVIFRKGL